MTSAISTQVVIATGIAAGLLVVVPTGWRYSRHLVTLTHEAAHGIVALASGRTLRGIRLHSDTSGLTVSRGRPDGLGLVLTSAAGYLGPGLIGLGAAALLSHGYPVTLLWSLLALLILMLIQIRNWFGLWSVLIPAIAVFAVTRWGTGSIQTGFAYGVTWFLLIAAPRPVIELQSLRWRGAAADSDADLLARLTPIPALLWVAAFLLGTAATLVIGGRWLLDARG